MRLDRNLMRQIDCDGRGSTRLTCLDATKKRASVRFKGLQFVNRASA